MPKPGLRFTVLYESNGSYFKLCKVFFGGDGSYYVTSPYHPHDRALVFKATVRYASTIEMIELSDALEVATLDDDEKRLKLSHHPDGFVQFSGEGVISGRDENGTPRGIGTLSWPLREPTAGPSFALVIFGAEGFTQVARPDAASVVFHEDDLSFAAEGFCLVLEGFYFPPNWHRFVRRRHDRTSWLQLVHPSRAVIDLEVIAPPVTGEPRGLIGLHLYAEPRASDEPASGFNLSGPTGDLRYDEEGDLRGDGVFAIYPAGAVTGRRVLNYNLNEPAYQKRREPPEN